MVEAVKGGVWEPACLTAFYLSIQTPLHVNDHVEFGLSILFSSVANNAGEHTVSDRLRFTKMGTDCQISWVHTPLLIIKLNCFHSSRTEESLRQEPSV